MKKLIRLYLCLNFIAIFLWSSDVMSLTPQMYCESLAVTSCEVLNINSKIVGGSILNAGGQIGAGIVYEIKYCRNRVFRVSIIAGGIAHSGGNYTYWVNGNNLTTTTSYNQAMVAKAGNPAALIPLSLDNSLCNQTDGTISYLP